MILLREGFFPVPVLDSSNRFVVPVDDNPRLRFMRASLDVAMKAWARVKEWELSGTIVGAFGVDHEPEDSFTARVSDDSKDFTLLVGNNAFGNLWLPESEIRVIDPLHERFGGNGGSPTDLDLDFSVGTPDSYTATLVTALQIHTQDTTSTYGTPPFLIGDDWVIGYNLGLLAQISTHGNFFQFDVESGDELDPDEVPDPPPSVDVPINFLNQDFSVTGYKTFDDGGMAFCDLTIENLKILPKTYWTYGGKYDGTTGLLV